MYKIEYKNMIRGSGFWINLSSAPETSRLGLQIISIIHIYKIQLKPKI